MSIINKVSRRVFLRGSGLAVAGLSLSACAFRLPALPSTPSAPTAPTLGPSPLETPVANADEALHLLMEGNLRYTSNESIALNQTESRRAEVAKAQHPFATIFSCVDSRVPPELVFDRGLGDLFVIRTAGQVIDSAVLGSLEFGVAELNIPLLMVLGHEKCGAVNATIKTVESHGTAPGEINWLVEGIRPAVEATKGQAGDPLNNAILANVALTVEHLKHISILSEAIAGGRLKIVGAEYSLESGVVQITVP